MSNLLALAAAVLYLSAKTRNPGDKLEIARTKYNNAQLPDEHLPYVEVQRVKQLCDEGSKYGQLYHPDISTEAKQKLNAGYEAYMHALRQDTMRLEGGDREIESVNEELLLD